MGLTVYSIFRPVSYKYRFFLALGWFGYAATFVVYNLMYTNIVLAILFGAFALYEAFLATSYLPKAFPSRNKNDTKDNSLPR